MHDRVSLETPDLARLEFELAGIGSRFGAYFIDSVLSTLFLIALLFFFGVTGALGSLFVDEAAESAALALLFLAVFLIRWGYFIFFEILMQGRTPGKKMLGIRVIRDNGLPIGPREALIRNLLRFVDTLPPPAYFVGGFAALFNREGKRLGDMAAGTIVVREQFDLVRGFHNDPEWGARWVARLESGKSRHAVNLPTGKVTVKQLALMDQFLDRAHKMKWENRANLSWRIARPYLAAFDLDPAVLANDPKRGQTCEEVIANILAMAKAGPETAAANAVMDRRSEEKRTQWLRFAEQAQKLLKRGKAALTKLRPKEIEDLLADHRQIIADLGRARAMDADHRTLDRLNRMAVGGHNLLYGQARRTSLRPGGRWLASVAATARRHAWAVALAATCFFAPALISYTALQLHPELGYDLVPETFLHFEPAQEENLHDIPDLVRPVAASQIIANNLQVSLLAFGLGLTFGIGTCLILIFNGVHIGAVAGWMAVQGNSRALWGWVMPHGGTEILAIVLAGAAGFILARALVAPGRLRRVVALKRAAFQAVTLELGVMGMLLIAGVIEGFISPSAIGYSARIAILALSLAFWLVFYALHGRANRTRTVPESEKVGY